MELVHEFTYRATLDRQVIGPVPFGTRVVFTVTGGWAKGERINGKAIGAGGDWMLMGSDGFGRLDVRGQIQTNDGAVLYVSYAGLLEMNQSVQTATSAGSETGYNDQYFRTMPRIESGDDRYTWVNKTLFVARGRIVTGGVEYEVYRIT